MNARLIGFLSCALISLVPSPAASQSALADAFCTLFEGIQDEGSDAFIESRGEQIGDEKWALQSDLGEGADCFIRSSSDTEHALICRWERSSQDDAATWATNMTGLWRECFDDLGGFEERQRTSEVDGDTVNRTSWDKDTDDYSLRISLASIFRSDGDAENSLQIRYGDQ
jgi:hypothetical protein